MANSMHILYLVAGILAAIGAINWGSTAVLNFNVVDKLFKGSPSVEKAIYALIGIAGIIALIGEIKWATSPNFKNKQ